MNFEFGSAQKAQTPKKDRTGATTEATNEDLFIDKERLRESLVAWIRSAGIEDPETFVEKTFEIDDTTGEVIVEGDLNLHGTSIQEVPVGIHVKGNANFDDCPSFATAPEIKVGRTLMLQGTAIRSLPENLDLSVGLAIYVDKHLEADAEKLKRLGKVKYVMA